METLILPAPACERGLLHLLKAPTATGPRQSHFSLGAEKLPGPATAWCSCAGYVSHTTRPTHSFLLHPHPPPESGAKLLGHGDSACRLVRDLATSQGDSKRLRAAGFYGLTRPLGLLAGRRGRSCTPGDAMGSPTKATPAFSREEPFDVKRTEELTPLANRGTDPVS